MCCLFDREPCECAQLDYPCQIAIDTFQPLQRAIDREYRDLVAWCRFDVVLRRHPLVAVAALPSPMTTGMVNENPSHDLRAHPEEMRAVLPVATPLVDEPQIRFVHQSGRLKAMSRPLATELALRDAPQFGIDNR